MIDSTKSTALVGFAFNNRLLLGGFAGEPQSSEGGLTPLNDPAQENLTLLVLDAHRMLDFESAALQHIPTFVELFKRAFPEEAHDYVACKAADANALCQAELDKLVNDDSVLRATATFLRTAVTRNTPFDRFLAGEDSLSERQRDGAKLFFSKAEEGGAGCFSCHSSPMLNKQPNDPDVTGRGELTFAMSCATSTKASHRIRNSQARLTPWSHASRSRAAKVRRAVWD